MRKKEKFLPPPRFATSFVFLLALIGGIGIYSLATSPVVANVLGVSTKLAQNIYPWYFNKPTPTPFAPTPQAITNTPATAIAFSPQTKELSLGQEYQANVYLNTNGNRVNQITFGGVLDPNKFLLISIQNNSPFLNILNNTFFPESGKFSYTVSTNSVSTVFNGSMIMATLRFRVRSTALVNSSGKLVTQVYGEAYGPATGTTNLMTQLNDGTTEVFIRPALPTPLTSRTQSPTQQPQSTCKRTGCSGTICSDREVITTCNYLPEFACYQNAVCERQTDGNCGFTQTSELKYCLNKFVSPTPTSGRISVTPSPLPRTSSTPSPIRNVLLNPRFDTCQVYPWNKINGVAINKSKQETQMSIFKDNLGNCKLKVSCGSASCLDNQAVYQDLSALNLRGKTVQYSGLFTSSKGSSNLSQVLYALDGNGKIVGQATIPMTISQADSKGNSAASIPTSAQSKFVVPTTAVTLRYQINFKTIPEAVTIDNLTLYTN